MKTLTKKLKKRKKKKRKDLHGKSLSKRKKLRKQESRVNRRRNLQRLISRKLEMRPPWLKKELVKAEASPMEKKVGLKKAAVRKGKEATRVKSKVVVKMTTKNRSGQGSKEELTRERKHSAGRVAFLTVYIVHFLLMTSKSFGGSTFRTGSLTH